MSSSPASSNSDKTFTLDPSDNLTYTTTYLTRVTTGVKDIAGNTLSSQYDTSNGLTTSGIWLISTNDGVYLTSSDNGTTWTRRTLFGNQTLRGLSYGDGTFVMGGNEHNTTSKSNYWTSSDGLNWTIRDDVMSKPSQAYAANGITYGNNTWVMVSNEGNLWTSSDAVSWDNRTKFTGVWESYLTSRQFNEGTFGNNTFVVVGQGGVIVTSSDNGTSWDNRTSGSTTGDVRRCCIRK